MIPPPAQRFRHFGSSYGIEQNKFAAGFVVLLDTQRELIDKPL